ncbi:zinc finger protein 182 isoform X2 [Bicyclus anynana]|uniref:Zinc finger protein 182 isoform X2 n=1 Tax=Bicyclus anynana TaxID=110368 RepID=A0ABM3M4F7_BICAN|nr:zinc finger protein 182 isoform X2 [Bicyclus anynana]
MQCCVPFCVNTSDNASTSERIGITFHELPSEGNLRTAWLRALGTQDHHLPDPAVVCSQHFLDDDFCTTESCVRQIHSHAIPSIVQMCMICLDTGSKLSLMSKHKLEEAYEQLTGLSLCRRGNLKQTLCVLCAQRLINFSRFRDLSLRAHSLMTDLVEQHELNTIQLKELMNCTTAHLKCNLTQTTLGANHCDLYIDHTDEEEQTAAEESVVGHVATVVVKKERSSDSMLSADNLAQEDHCVSKEEYDISIKIEEDPLAEAVSDALHRKAATSCTAVAKHEIEIKSESVTFGCTICFQEFVEEIAYYEHMIMHLQDAGGDAAYDASQVCKPRAAVSRSGDSLVLQNKTGSQRLSDEPPPAAGCALSVVAPLSARLAANDESKVQATEGAGVIVKSEQFLEIDICELDNRSSQSGTKIYTDINRSTNYVGQLYDIFKKPKLTVLHENPRVKTHTRANRFSCKMCNDKFPKKSKLLRHMKTHTDAKRYSCDVCNYKTGHKGNYDGHMKTHTGEKPFSCEICNYKFAHKHHLSDHMRTHTGEKPYSCELCDYKAAQKGNFVGHMKKHTGEKPFSCEICNYKFALKHHLSDHMKKHTGEKPFSCDTCNYKCTRKQRLLEHMKTHTGDMPYSCNTCDYKCTRKSVLLVHIRTHTGEKPFSCDKCNYKVAHKSNLLRHMKAHTGEKPYSCETCNYKCTQKSLLLIHNRTHTAEKEDMQI